jgi:hypothetical protein
MTIATKLASMTNRPANLDELGPRNLREIGLLRLKPSQCDGSVTVG